jgi:ketosteroid isomerase-like protein
MRMILFAGLLMMTAPAFAEDKQDITQAEDAWRQARIKGDTAFLERFYAKEGRIQGMDGRVQSREKDIDLFTKGVIKPKFIDHGPLDISVYGQTAVVTGLDHLGGTYAGHYGEMYLRFTDVLVKRDGRWQLVVQQATTSKAE